MRIISGKYKGHSLVSFQNDKIRPTTDRVKESQFNILMGRIEGARVLDLFCGTGNLGLEALSREATSVLFVDVSAQSLQITQKNLDKLKVDPALYSLKKSEALSFLKSYRGEPFDLIFIDPPFTEKMAHEVMEGMSQSLVFGANTLLTIESQKRERMESQYGDLVRIDAREFGDKILSFFAKSEDK